MGFLGGLSALLMANMFGSRLNSSEVAGFFWIMAALMARAYIWAKEGQGVAHAQAVAIRQRRVRRASGRATRARASTRAKLR